jgi:hypothetical protein
MLITVVSVSNTRSNIINTPYSEYSLSLACYNKHTTKRKHRRSEITHFAMATKESSEPDDGASLFDCSMSFLTDELCRVTDDEKNLDSPFFEDGEVIKVPGEGSLATAEANELRLLRHRGEKIVSLGDRTNKLSEGAQNYAAMAKQLKVTMQAKRKTWFFAKPK